MVIRVDNPETESLIRELARLRGKSITQALNELFRREIERHKDYTRRCEMRDQASRENNP